MTLALRYVAHSEIGLVRKNNQDSAYVSPTMLVVADGMGGAAAGDLASAVAIRELRNVDGDHTAEDMLTALEAAITNAGEQISDLIESDPALDGMGSTVCGLMFDGASLGIVNIGDSRAYRFADGVLTRLTRDHSWVQTLVDEGRITEAEALEHPHRSLILRVINGQPQHVPDLELADAREGDRLLICSDGLCGMVTDAAIQAHLTGEREQALGELVALAHSAGGQDNITIIVADIVQGERTGEAEVLGSAATLDLEASFVNTTAQLALPRDDAGLEPRPGPGYGESARYS
ncbi:MAG: protein phosphatase 2C domain-containing protein, partial [Propionicimonas sp.]